MSAHRRPEQNGKLRCSHCLGWFLPDDFYTKDSGRRDSRCKNCKNILAMKYRGIRPTKWYRVDVHTSAVRARQLGVLCTLTAEEWKTVVEGYEYSCYLCGRILTIELSQPNTVTLEHITPMSRGGTHTKENVAPACFVCNSAKRNMTVEEFRALARLWAERG
jgi:5-methylcytosine-specific restriction endonuclease McrA